MPPLELDFTVRARFTAAEWWQYQHDEKYRMMVYAQLVLQGGMLSGWKIMDFEGKKVLDEWNPKMAARIAEQMVDEDKPDARDVWENKLLRE